ncbi:E7 [Macaca mulatta papillomavirus 6]|uniref:E7 n=1 Tax=Macaca mulatta papillomavirus 6 TaxID=2364646 RepID=UPI000EB64DA5|nr:E7 [Macaca mulatta papillomavirus 6]AYD74606.1 E7 [Macaca mulatta papillomavirus 6]
MHGTAPTLKEIVLELQPEPVLYCNEVLEESDDEDLVDAIQPIQPEGQAYKVLSVCAGGCGRSVRLVVWSTAEGILQLEQLLVQDALSIVCPTCAPKL